MERVSTVNIRTRLRYVVASMMLVSSTILGLMASSANAASLSNTYVRLNRMSATTASSVRVVFRVPAGNATTEDSLVVSFPDSFTIATSGQTSNTATCATETGATALPGTLTVTGNNTNGTKALTVTGVTNLSASTTYCVDLTKADAVTNPAAGQYTLTVATQASAVNVDTASAAVRVISDDQVVVSAVVPASFNFVLDANTTSFTTNLDSASVVSTTGRTVTITTNAASGWITWVSDSNQGLTSAIASKTINTTGTVDGSASTLSAGTEGYVLDVNLTSDAAGGGTVSVAGEYNGAGANDGGTLSASFQPAASSNGTAGGAGDVLTFVGKAAIAGDTPAAGDYTDTWTIIGAGTY